jgi:hypothetical protein
VALQSIVVDPYLVCLPQNCRTAGEVEDFIDNLISWGELLQREDVKVYFSEHCCDTLLQEEHYPYGHNLKNLMKRFELSELPVDFACSTAQWILDRTPRLEDKCCIGILDFDDASFLVEPAFLTSRLSEALSWSLKHTFSVIACHHAASQDEFMLASVGSAEPGDAEENDRDHLRFSVTVIDLDNPEVKINLPLKLPARIEHTMPVAFGRDAVTGRLGSLALWELAQSDMQARDAINSRIKELALSGAADAGAAKPFRVGSRFLDTARTNGFASRLNVVDSCARILLEIPKKPVKPFRVSEDSETQRTRSDGAKAFRTHLTSDGPGYRLMFWEMADGTIEFANVGPKRELVIQ